MTSWNVIIAMSTAKDYIDTCIYSPEENTEKRIILIHPYTDNHCKLFAHINEEFEYAFSSWFVLWYNSEKIDFLTQTHAAGKFEQFHWCFRRSSLALSRTASEPALPSF